VELSQCGYNFVNCVGPYTICIVCEQDLEGIICKPKTSPYPFTWIKVKNPNYSQAVGRKEMFDSSAAAAIVRNLTPAFLLPFCARSLPGFCFGNCQVALFVELLFMTQQC
jgi:hypothetical protein